MYYLTDHVVVNPIYIVSVRICEDVAKSFEPTYRIVANVCHWHNGELIEIATGLSLSEAETRLSVIRNEIEEVLNRR